MNLQRFAKVVGIIFLLLGIIGFFIHDLFGLMHFDLVHNIFHLAVGILGIMASRSTSASHLFAKVFGIVFLILGLIGVFVPEWFGHMMLETTENIMHLIVGAIASYLGFVMESTRMTKATKTS